MMAVIAFGAICVFALVMFVLERRAAARRLKARGGRRGKPHLPRRRGRQGRDHASLSAA